MKAETHNGMPAGKKAVVTIVIPCYNHAHYLEECLRSLQSQNLTDWEAIVVDDASPDQSLAEKVVQKVNDARIRIIRHDKNSGLGASRNTGFRESRTELVYPLDADDKLTPDCLSSLVLEFSKDPELDCAYGDVLLFGRRDDVLEFPGPGKGGRVLHPEDTIPGAGTMMRRSFWERVGGYDESEELRRGREDFEFYVRAFQQGCKSVRVQKPLYLYRISHTSMSIECYHEDDIVANYIVRKNPDAFKTRREVNEFLSYFYQRAALASYDKHFRGRALRLAVRAFQLAPNRDRLVSVGKTALPASLVRSIRQGELRRRTPFLGYPLAGEQRFRPFFIIGVARSGNTLFRRILTSHSKLYIPPETFVLGECIQKFRHFGKRMNWPDLVHFIFSLFEFHSEFHTFNVWLGPLVNRLIDLPARQRNLAFLLNSFYRYHARMQERSMERWGDKTPLNSLDDTLVRGNMPSRIGEGVPETLKRLQKVFPDAQFIHIYRDGCDVAHSFLRGGFVASVEDAGIRWLHTIRQTRRFVRENSAQCHSVRYEDLVSNSEDTIRHVCRFLNIGFEPVMLQSEKEAAKLGDVPEWSWHQQVARPINPANPGKGRQFLSPDQKEKLHSIIGAELESLGYEPATAVQVAAKSSQEGR